MVATALSPMRVIEGLQDLVLRTASLALCRRVRVACPTKGRHEVYRSSKAALNQCMRSYAARHAGEPRARC